MRRLPWTTGAARADVPEPPLDTRHVVYAGESSRARWVLVAGADPAAAPAGRRRRRTRAIWTQLDSVAIAWFTGPRDAAAEEMTLYGEPRIVDADEPTAVLSPTRPTARRGAPSSVAAPGDQIEGSGLRWIEPDGDALRDFERMDLVDGVDVGEGYGRSTHPSTWRPLYRVVRGGTEFLVVPATEPAPDFVPPDVDLARLRPAPPPAPGDAAVTRRSTT